MTSSFWRRVAWCLPALLATSCGGDDSGSAPAAAAACLPASPPEFAYLLTGDSVSMYTVDSCNGSFTATTPASVATGTTSSQIAPEDLAVDPAGRFAYVANLVSNAADDATISMYVINPQTGVLTSTSPPTIATGFFPQGITVDPGGKFVYTANSDDNTISMFTVDATSGILTATSPAAVATGRSPLSVTVHPSGKFAYAANQVDDTVSMYTIDATTGVLVPTTPATVPTDFSPFGVTVTPSGKFAYVPNAYSNGNTVSQYSIDPLSGVLSPNTPATVVAGNQPTAVAVDPSSRFAYVVNRLDATVTMFSIDPTTGNLAAMGIVAAGSQPFRIAFDPSGKFVYVANEGGPASVYTVNADGTLAAGGTTGAPSGALAIGFASVNP